MARAITPLYLIALLYLACTPSTPSTNLTWIGPKNYVPATVEIYVDNLGVEDTVDVLPPGAAFSVSRSITNTGTAVASGYEVKEEVLQWVFQSAAGSVGWAPGDPDTHTVYTDSLTRPSLAGGATDSVSFSIPSLPCGLYQEILTVDSDGVVAESDEGDNEGLHFFFVPSLQQFNIGVVTIDDALFHEDPATNTHDFTVTPAGPPGVVAWVYGHFSFVATEGSQAATVPPPPVVGSPALISMFVTPRTHNVPGGFQPTVTGKVTVISQDGCVVKQETARVFIEHE